MQDPEYVKNAFSGIAKRYVITNHILSLGIDILWRKKVSKLIALKEPKNVLDLATGRRSGHGDKTPVSWFKNHL